MSRESHEPALPRLRSLATVRPAGSTAASQPASQPGIQTLRFVACIPRFFLFLTVSSSTSTSTSSSASASTLAFASHRHTSDELGTITTSLEACYPYPRPRQQASPPARRLAGFAATNGRKLSRSGTTNPPRLVENAVKNTAKTPPGVRGIQPSNIAAGDPYHLSHPHPPTSRADHHSPARGPSESWRVMTLLRALDSDSARLSVLAWSHARSHARRIEQQLLAASRNINSSLQGTNSLYHHTIRASLCHRLASLDDTNLGPCHGRHWDDESCHQSTMID